MKNLIQLSFIALNKFFANMSTCVKKNVPHQPEASLHVTALDKYDRTNALAQGFLNFLSRAPLALLIFIICTPTNIERIKI